jgi:hypothetical protein
VQNRPPPSARDSIGQIFGRRHDPRTLTTFRRFALKLQSAQ